MGSTFSNFEKYAAQSCDHPTLHSKAPRRCPHTFFPVLNTLTKNPPPRCHTGDQRVTRPALCLDEIKVHLFSQGKSGCSHLRLYAFGAGMAGVGEVALVEERAVACFVTPTVSVADRRGGGRGKRSGQGERSEQRPRRAAKRKAR
jgi:hypothetical protein